MNLVTKRSLLLIATLITGLISIQSHADVFGGSGQFAMMTASSGNDVIFILDTETGRVRNCQSIGPSEPPKCTPWSEE